jgi:dolichol-phosphate mannosyltransferase
MSLAPANSNVLVAVCTYNEQSNVAELTQRIFDALPDCHLLFVDDNSPDGTADWVLQRMESDSRIRLVIRKDERGLGGATRRALQYAVDQQYKYLLNLDGDLSHDPSVLPTMLSIAEAQPEIDVVVGSRYVADGSIDGWPMRRRVMSRMVNQFATTILRLPVTDCSGSMRCYRVAALAKLDPRTLKSESYAILEETLVRLSKNGSKMIEVPIHFIDRARGSSKLTSREAMKSAIQLFRVAIRT